MMRSGLGKAMEVEVEVGRAQLTPPRYGWAEESQERRGEEVE